MATTDLGADSVRANPISQSPSLRLAISAAMRRYGIPASRFGREAVNDPCFVFDIMRRDRACRPATEARARTYIATLEGC